MKKKIILFITGSMLLTGCGSTMLATQNLTKNAGTAIVCYAEKASLEPLHQFSYNFFQGNMSEENPVLSPLSAYYALSLAASGADGETKAELEAVLGENYYQICDELMDTVERTVKDKFGAEKEQYLQISLANSAWIDDGFKADKDWLLDINTYFESEVFKSKLSTNEAMMDINTWCSNKTNGLIPQFLSRPLAEDVRLALFNALYFNGRWRDHFSDRATKEKDFYLEDGTTVKVDMMKKYSDYNYYFEKENLKGVCLPYYDDVTFVALMPTDDTDIRELVTALSPTDLQTFAQTSLTTYSNIELPKFEAAYSMKLIDYFKTQGIEAAFDPQLADFHIMGKATSNNNIYIAEILQKAVIKVTEDGTEAGAVTMVAPAEGAAEETEQPIDIFFNRPFFYMIYDKKSDVPLFMGIYEKP